jgi:Ner family transcriptional regulator
MTTVPDPETIPADPMQRNEWIKFQLRIRGSSLSQLARDLGVTRQAVRNALSSRYPRMERVIAAEIGLDPEIIWPERYRKDQTAPNE